jgi:23S rRNA (cytosine1962-C5)-methyltransferase
MIDFSVVLSAAAIILEDRKLADYNHGMEYPQAVLKPRKSRPFYARHPWVLDSAIERVEGSPVDGDVVDLLSEKGKFLARGFYNSQSRIRLRLYTWNVAENIDETFWRQRLATAIAWRRELGYDDPRGAARLVFSEGDRLSGLIVDRYAGYLAVQVTALGVARRLTEIAPLLLELSGAKGIVLRTEKGIKQAEGLELRDGPYCGETPSEMIEIVENGLRYAVDLTEGQKTGCYLDQRENRKTTAGYLRGRRVLDVFCYNGGFSLAAAALGGAADILGIDASAKAVAAAEHNARINGIGNVRFQAGDAFKTLEQLAEAGEIFQAVILDPPKFARSRGALAEALRAYHWLNRLALKVLAPGGILVTCSCSGHVTRQDFAEMLVGVSQQSHRDIQILEQRGAAPDHPVLTSCGEGEYLKCFICRVL